MYACVWGHPLEAGTTPLSSRSYQHSIAAQLKTEALEPLTLAWNVDWLELVQAIMVVVSSEHSSVVTAKKRKKKKCCFASRVPDNLSTHLLWLFSKLCR